jgi:hypothetical protein
MDPKSSSAFNKQEDFRGQNGDDDQNASGANTFQYSEEKFSPGEESYPQNGHLILGQTIRDELKRSHQQYLLEQLNKPENSKEAQVLFEEMQRDFDRATFIIKTASQEEKLLYDHQEEMALKKKRLEAKRNNGAILSQNYFNNQVVNELRAKALREFQFFVGPNRALQIAIGSLMYQRGTLDLEIMKNEFINEGIPNSLFAIGFRGVEGLELTSAIRPETSPDTQLCYTLEKVSSLNSDPSFQLTIFRSVKEERFHQETKQEFTLYKDEFLIYTFEKNSNFHHFKSFSLTNLPVVIGCQDGKLQHVLTPFKGVRPPLPDTIGLSQWKKLTIEQQETVARYQEAEHRYVDAKQHWENRLSSLAGRPLQPPLIAGFEKNDTENRLKALRNDALQAAYQLTEDRATAPFLERNFITSEGKTEALSSLWGGSSLSLPESLSFLGGRELQQATTDQMKEALIVYLNQQQDKHALIAAAKKLTLKESEQSDIELTKFSDDDEVRNDFCSFTGNGHIDTAVSMLVNDPQIGISSLLSKEPLFGDMLTFFPNATAELSLEKKPHSSSIKPLFILTVDYHLSHAEENDSENFERGLHAHFVYALKNNPLCNFGELISIDNLPVEIRCIDIRIGQTVTSTF